MKKIKPTPIRKARKETKRGIEKLVAIEKNRRIENLNLRINEAARQGKTFTSIWYRNEEEGVLTSTVMLEILEVFKTSGYEVIMEHTKSAYYGDEYDIKIKWEEAACEN